MPQEYGCAIAGRMRIMNLKIGVIKGDGIGPEIVTEAMKVLDKVAETY